MGSIEENLGKVRMAVAEAAKRAGRDPAEVRLVAVSKTRPVKEIRRAIAAGQLDFGENYAQELRDKMKEIAEPGVRWHFIGHLQKNKVKYVAGKVAEMHSLDGADLARELSRRAEGSGAVLPVFIEVNLGGEETKSGVDEDDVEGLLDEAKGLAGLEVVGLMTMPPYFADPEESRPYYRRLRELRDGIRQKRGAPEMLPHLSMGLSHDFEVAVEEGATRVRVGTAIFGERDYG